MDKNFTPMPNRYLDVLMGNLPAPAFIVLAYIARRTYGFQKKRDRISLTQFESGIEKKDGEQLDNGTGLSRKTIVKAIQILQEKGVIIVHKEGMTSEYEVVEEIHHLPTKVVDQVHRTSGGDPPKVVEEIHTQKKGKESIQKKEASRLFLKNLPEDVIKEMTDNFKCTPANVRAKALTILDYCDSKGKVYKNYKATLRNWLRRDFGDRDVVVSKKPKYEIRRREDGSSVAVQVGWE